MNRFKVVAAIFCVSLVALAFPFGVKAIAFAPQAQEDPPTDAAAPQAQENPPTDVAAPQAQEDPPTAAVAPQGQEYLSTELFSANQLDNLLAPIALYPDPLLAQVLPASTFVDQVDEAARWLRANNDRNLIDEQPWDISVRAVAHYPSVLFMMADKIDWTTSLGQAYVYQSTDVMTSIQRLRAMAHNAGNLVSNQQQQVIEEGNYIRIDPYQPQYMYVPVYDPGIVYYQHGYGGGFGGGFISFGAGFIIGAWLNNDFDWGGHRVYYHGWQGGGWIGRSRPNVHINNIYVNNTYTNIRVNQTVINNNVNYNNLSRYNSVHREVTYNNVAQNRRGVAGTSGSQVYPGIQGSRENQGNPAAGNKVINRNVNPNDPRIDAYRGRQPLPQPATRGTIPAQPTQARPSPSQVTQPSSLPQQGRTAVRDTQITPQIPATRGTIPAQPTQARPSPSQVTQPSSLPQQQGRTAVRDTQATPQMTRPAPSRDTRQSQPVAPAVQTPARQTERPSASPFKVSSSPVDPRAASQRGQASRTQTARPEGKPTAGASSKPEKHSTPPAAEKGHKQN